MRVVLDTNILIAAALKSGLSEDIIEMAATTHLLTLLASEEILKEFTHKMIAKFKWKQERIAFFVEKLRRIVEIIIITEKVNVITRDPDDNKILDCALSGHADMIVTADQDLIKLKTFRGIAIVHPKTLSWTFPKYFKKSKR